MKVAGVDFTSKPSTSKAITVARGWLEGRMLKVERIDRLTTFAAFEAMLVEPGPWVAGFDFPFGQTRRFVADLGWPLHWQAYVRHVEALGAHGFARAVKAYEARHAAGAKQPRRAVDRHAGGQPPQKVQWQPVGLMFAQGAPRLLASDVHIPLLHETGEDRVAIEVYPGVMARALIGRTSYKSELGCKAEARERSAKRTARERLVAAVTGGAVRQAYGLDVAIADPATLLDDAKGDALDAVLAAVQAAWASRQPTWGMPAGTDPLEGWIADPHVLEAAPA